MNWQEKVISQHCTDLLQSEAMRLCISPLVYHSKTDLYLLKCLSTIFGYLRSGYNKAKGKPR